MTETVSADDPPMAAAPAPDAKFIRDFYHLMRGLDAYFDGQVSLRGLNDEDITEFFLEVRPSGGPYQGGEFVFSVRVDECYPQSAPNVFCHTPVYHPNIDTENSEENHSGTNICINLLSDDWTPELTLVDCVQAMLFLFYNPNINDPLSTYFDSTDGDLSEEEFAAKVRQSLRGEMIDDWIQLPPNYKGCDDVTIEAVAKNNDVAMPDDIKNGSDVARTDDAMGSDVAMNDDETKDVQAPNIVAKNDMIAKTDEVTNESDVVKTDDVTNGSDAIRTNDLTDNDDAARTNGVSQDNVRNDSTVHADFPLNATDATAVRCVANLTASFSRALQIAT